MKKAEILSVLKQCEDAFRKKEKDGCVWENICSRFEDITEKMKALPQMIFSPEFQSLARLQMEGTVNNYDLFVRGKSGFSLKPTFALYLIKLAKDFLGNTKNENVFFEEVAFLNLLLSGIYVVSVKMLYHSMNNAA